MIQLENVAKTYASSRGDVKALKSTSLHVEAGEIYGIIGLSGAGKSTLVRCINMLETPTSGRVLVDGEDLTAMSATQLRHARQNIGMIFQHFNLLACRTVYDNIAFPLEIQGVSKDKIKTKVDELLDLVGLKDRSNHYPAQLSGGQKQRVGIARALASNPKVLLCDEATSALDPQTTKSILQLLQDINKRLHITIVLITHQMQVVKEICDRVAVMENGIVIEEGTMFEIFTNPQQETTKEFVSSIQNNELPEMIKKMDLAPAYKDGSRPLIRLSFIGDSAGEPVISTLIKKYDVDVNILIANLETIKDIPYGTLLIELQGDSEHIKKAMSYLDERQLKVEVIGYVS